MLSLYGKPGASFRRTGRAPWCRFRTGMRATLSSARELLPDERPHELPTKPAGAPPANALTAGYFRARATTMQATKNRIQRLCSGSTDTDPESFVVVRGGQARVDGA